MAFAESIEPDHPGVLALHLTSRPQGLLSVDHLAVVKASLPRLTPGTVLVENHWFSIDRLPTPETVNGWTVHRPVVAGPVIGRVSRSRSASMPVGSFVLHRAGWTTHAVLAAGSCETRLLDPSRGHPVSAYLSVLGEPGLSAFIGLVEVLRLKPGESIFVANVEEPFGAIAVRLARAMNAGHVVGGVTSLPVSEITIRDAQVDAVVSLGAESISAADIVAACGEGVDAALICPGSRYLEAALTLVREYGRVAWAHGPEPALRRGVSADSLARVHARSIRLEGYQPKHFLHLRLGAERKLAEVLLGGDARVVRPASMGFAQLVDALVLTVERGYISEAVFQVAHEE